MPERWSTRPSASRSVALPKTPTPTPRRATPTRMRRALMARDRTCRWPGCTARGHHDAHHIEFWGDGGRTVLENLVLLCRFHHRHVHEGGYELVKDGSRFRFFAPAGWEIPSVP